jgi:broad specificity phosphatase PhoE
MPVQIVHLFRHAEVEHNSSNDISLRDPLLTATGLTQSENITRTYKFLNAPTLILVSSPRRCIQTALHAFHPAFNTTTAKNFPNPPRIVAMPHIQEVTENPCDTGSSLELLKAQYGQYVEFGGQFFKSDD